MMRSVTLHKVQILAFLLDDYWKPGLSIRAADLVLALHESRRIKIPEKTMYNILDSLTEDQILTVSNLTREKAYAINEELDAGALRDEIVRLLGITSWVRWDMGRGSEQTPSRPVGARVRRHRPRDQTH